MAARKKVRLADKQKENIRATQIMNRLSGFVLDEKGVNGEKIVLTPAQVAAGKVVLGKLIPDLKSTELTGSTEKPLAFALTVNRVKPTDQSS